MRHGIMVLFVAASVGTPLALGQSSSTRPAERQTTSVLQGPIVQQVPRTSLIERESDGSIRRSDVPPEVAALRLLELPGEVAARIEEIITRRGRFLETFVENNIELLNELDTAGNTGDKLDQALLGIKAMSKLAPLTKDGSLKKQIRALLPGTAAERYDSILKEYWDAIVSQEKSRDSKKSRVEILVGERAQSVFREVEAAFKRLEKSGSLLFYYLFDKIELSKEQEGEIRALLDEFVDETKGNATPQQEGAMFFALLSKLNVKQQNAVMRKVQGVPPQKEKPAPKKTEATPDSDEMKMR